MSTKPRILVTFGSHEFEVIPTGREFTLNGRTLAVAEAWQCACSGGHAPNDPSLKCYAKGGEWDEWWIDMATRTAYAMEIDPLDAPRMVEQWGWVHVAGDMYRHESMAA